MHIVGLSVAAWVIILVAVATYTALASAYFLARPVLRGSALQANLLLLQTEAAADPRLAEIRDRAVSNLTARLTNRIPEDRRSNRTGLAFLVLSVLSFSAAIALQLRTDPAFTGAEACQCQPGGSAPTAPAVQRE